MSDAPDPYPIEPSPENKPSPPPMPVARLASDASGSTPKPKIEAPGLLDDFEEDADFTADPEVDLAAGRAPTKTVSIPDAPPPPEFVKPGLGEPRHWAIVGGVLLLAAMIAAGVTAPSGIGAGQVALRIILTLYNTLLSAGTGVVALFITARLLEMRFGSVELAAGRMFAAVSAFMLIENLSLRLTGAQWLNNVITLILAVGAYLLIIAGTFKLWDRVRLAYVAGAHMLLWLIMLVGMELTAAIKPAPPQPTGTATPIRSAPPPSSTTAPPATGVTPANPKSTPIR